jgi:hypothetical protein
MSEATENRVLSVMSALIEAGLGPEARFVHQLWSDNERLREALLTAIEVGDRAAVEVATAALQPEGET